MAVTDEKADEPQPPSRIEWPGQPKLHVYDFRFQIFGLRVYALQVSDLGFRVLGFRVQAAARI